MNKIEGTVIEAGNITLIDEDEALCGLVIETTRDQLRAHAGAFYGREVVVEAKADRDARELGIEQLCEQMGQLRIDLAAHAASLGKTLSGVKIEPSLEPVESIWNELHGL